MAEHAAVNRKGKLPDRCLRQRKGGKFGAEMQSNANEGGAVRQHFKPNGSSPT